ncbi:NlpC/P60 family protein [Bacillus thuringiensis]|uniref:N-acetylmuramoyl-L-alanine amidase n=1 Tax=Bacillus thuringiensis subsp. higo TaxID=132266 RepID=A0A9X6LFB6_BACUH|nr:C40 family peptidase [Bacillus thuringiensis]MCA1000033.1 NlpC/P60 family protein [Bacillus thuringiensis]MED2785340.1 NlpC/P60 family protein [Bacillus thuringiensis]MED2807141.1 NlpC/P60 family protein [Bacillus thuringiensis]MED2825504.1 NlpC/P60 family protein [Bacillus thuringiensis]MED2831778.1 NlpC/P60 family protein [Bacillus thuringiensis]
MFYKNVTLAKKIPNYGINFIGYIRKKKKESGVKNKMKKLKMASCALVAGLMFSGLTPNVFAEDKISDVKSQINTQNDTLHKQQQERDELQKQMNDLNKTIQGLDKSVQENAAKLDETTKKVSDTEQLIEKKNKDIAELQTKIAKREELLRKRLVALQEQPNTNVVTEVLVNSKNVADLVDRLTSVSKILESDEDIMKTQQEDQASVKKDVATVKEKQKELKEAQAQIETAKKELDAEKEKKATAVNDLSGKMDTVVTTMTSTESQLKELEQQALKLQQIAEKEAQEKAAQEAAAQKQAEQAAKDAQAQPAQQPAQTQAQPAAPANNAVQAPKEEPKKEEKKATATPAPEVPADNGGGRQDVVSKAKGLVGLKYVWGSASISNGGFDCSGLISYVYGLGRQDTRSLWSSVQKISASEAKPGDLIFLQGTYREGVSHVGIYIGGGQIIHAADESTGVTYGSVNSSYNQKHFLGYGRL